MTRHHGKRRHVRKLRITKQEAARRLAVRYLEQSLQSPMRVPLKTYVEANWRHVAKDNLLTNYAGD